MHYFHSSSSFILCGAFIMKVTHFSLMSFFSRLSKETGKKMFSTKWLLSASFSLFGLIGQTYYISFNYFRHESVTQITMSRPPVLSVPNVLYCAEMQANETKLFENATLSLHFNRLPNFDLYQFGLVRGAKVIKGNETYFNAYFSISKLIRGNQYCYLIARKNRSEFNMNGENSGNIKYLYGFQYRNSFNFTANSYRLDLITSQENLEKSNLEYSVGCWKEHQKNCTYIVLTFKRFLNRLLPPPYETGCLDYASIGFSSKRDCFESCLNNETLKTTGKLHRSSFKSPAFGDYRQATQEEGLKASEFCALKCS